MYNASGTAISTMQITVTSSATPIVRSVLPSGTPLSVKHLHDVVEW